MDLQQLLANLTQSLKLPTTAMETGAGPNANGEFNDFAAIGKLQAEYLKEAAALLAQGFQAKPVQDKRFSAPAWSANPMAAITAAMYLLNSRTLLQMADLYRGPAKAKAKLRFAVQQMVDASSPANSLATNADALQKAIESKGASIGAGIKNLLADIQQGHMSQTDESQFEVGRNVATTPGSVVFENPLFQLIEYAPLTANVFERPLLIIPPCINKFYILDLQPANSLVRFAVAQGHRTFVLSWRNPDESLAQTTWDDYIEHAAIKAIETVRAISGASQINALGFCVGGTILSNALAVLAARALAPSDSNASKAKSKISSRGRSSKAFASPAVASATFLTTLLDFSDTGVLDLFIDEEFVQYREQQLAAGGLLKGQELASTFSFLRPNELVWNYLQNNYLKGETPPPFDLLYWNSDSTNLPGPMYAWYLRNTYLENNFVKPKQVTVCGQSLDLGLLSLPVYVYGSKDDHIVPIGGAYASMQHLPGPKRFVMGASGHIAGVINPPAANKRSHWINEKANAKPPQAHAQWLAGATEFPGSWWTDWAQWLKSNAGKPVSAPKALGGSGFKAIEAAPGRYVKAKA